MSKPKIFYLFTIPDCNYCQKAIQLLEDRELDYHVQEEHPESHTFMTIKEQHKWTTAPMIFEMDGQNETFIGGYTDLVNFLGQ